MKKSVIALILIAVLIVIVSPGIVGKLAEQSVDDNLDWAATESGELVVTSESFDRGWFSSEGQHRVELGDGQLRAIMVASDSSGEPLPALLINTRIDHGLIPVSSLGREQGSLTPSLGNAVSTLTIDSGDGEMLDLPGTIYTKVGLGGALDSRYILEAGSQTVDNGEVTWQAATINIVSSTGTGDIDVSGDIGTMTFANDQQVVTIDSLTFSGEQEATPYGFHVGDGKMSMGAMTITIAGMEIGGMDGIDLTARSSVNDDIFAADMQLEYRGQTVPMFGDISIIADMAVSGFNAPALGAVSQKLEEAAPSANPMAIYGDGEEEFKDLVAAGFDIAINQFDIELPMGTVEATMTIGVPESDRATFEWTSLLLNAVANADITIPEALVQLASSMDPTVGAMIGMGYLKQNGDVYEVKAALKQGLLTINGAPMPIPTAAFR